MTHYHEVYFNDHTSDGPRVGATRRTKAEILCQMKPGTDFFTASFVADNPIYRVGD